MLGCATPVKNYSPTRHKINFPPVNSTNIVSVGEVMLKYNDKVEVDVICLSSEVGIPLGVYKLTPGFYPKSGENKKFEFYLFSDEPGAGHLIRKWYADPFQAIGIQKKSGAIYGVTEFNLRSKMGTSSDYTRGIRRSNKDESFMQEIIYNGRSGDKIKIRYKEFLRTSGRSSANEVEYDLSESKIITYRGALLEVLKATSQDIQYKVLNNFDTIETK